MEVGVSSLSKADVEKLLSEPTPQLRAELAEKIGREIDSPELTESETGLAQDIIRVLARDIEASVRATLANSLRASRLLPHDVAVRLANDIDKVALPILSESQVLSPDDLIELVRASSLTKQRAIAGRNNLPEDVSEAIMDHAEEGAVSALLENATAAIGARGYDRALDRFSESETIKEKIVLRDTLPLSVSERLVSLVSERLGRRLVARHELSSSLATNIVMRSREATTLKFTFGRSEMELLELARDMQRHARLTPFLILQALCLGDLGFFVVAMAVRAGVPICNARTLVTDTGPNGLRALFDRASLPERLYSAIRVAVDVVRGVPFDGAKEELEEYRARILERILTQFENFEPAELNYLMGKLGDALDARAATRAA